MVRPSNDRQGARFLPRRPPSGTDSFANLFRDTTVVLQDLVADELARRGFDDLRPALLAVAQHIGAGGTRITELAARTSLTKATVVHAVDELERLGYVTREPDPTDRRAKLVTVTPRAREAEQVARAFAVEVRKAWAERLGAEEMDVLEAGLRRLRAELWPAADT